MGWFCYLTLLLFPVYTSYEMCKVELEGCKNSLMSSHLFVEKREVTPVELFQKRSSGELVCVSPVRSRLKLRTLCSTPTDPRSECAQTKEEKQKGQASKTCPS